MSDSFEMDEIGGDREYRWYEVRQAYGAAVEQALRQLETIEPDLTRELVESSGSCWQGAQIDAKAKELVAIAVLMTAGSQRRSQLKARLHSALNMGCSKRAILETVLEVALCADFKLAANGVRIAREVFQERSYDANDPSESAPAPT
ncbi:MAG: carboxymuconolactone decarboxylase family protein [Cyanobacteria bacterium J06639_1]